MPTAVSAPGKVLLAGGYLVLDRQYTGLVFGLSARIHVLVTEQDATLNRITVCSPQFINASWNYSYLNLDKGGGISVFQLADCDSGSLSSNRFIETTLTYVLTYIKAFNSDKTLPAPCQICILANTDYYSHTPQPLPAYPAFSSFHVSLSNAHKTGLGSSAALVTALTAALLTHYIPDFDPTKEVNRNQLHNLAQIVHCAAQGKVGSGFDIAAAVYGTCIYRRFSPSILANIGEPGTEYFMEHVKSIVDDPEGIWDVEIQKQNIFLPPGWALVMCDVDCGTETVSMVKRVLDWRKNNSVVANEIWGKLQQLQENFVAQLKGCDVLDVRGSLEEIRHQVRKMSQLSDVPIEPPEQTDLIDAVLHNVKGAIGGVVPGAGGYDAVVFLVRDPEATIKELVIFLERWSVNRGGKFKLLGSNGENDGAKLENYKNYTPDL